MRRVFTAVVLIFFISCISFSQVIIKEKVGIKPGVLKNLPSQLTEHVFTYKLTWEASEYSRGNIKIVTCSNDTINSGWSTSGNTTISYKGNGRHYFLIQEERYYYDDYNGYGWHSGDILPGTHWQEFIDNLLIHDSYGLLGGYNGVNGNFDLNIDGWLCPSDFAALSIDNIQWAECNDPGWYSTDPLVLRIAEGEAFVSLYDMEQGIDLGNSIQLENYNDIQHIKLKGKETAPLVTEPQKIKLEADLNGVMVTKETEFPSNNFTIDPWLQGDSIFFSTSRQIYLYIYNDCSDLPSQIKINIEIIEGNEYGFLINPFTGEKTQFMNNLDHYSGYLPFTFISDGKQADSVVSVLIRVNTTDPDIPHKDIKLFIRPSQILITLEPGEIRPGDTSKVIIKKKNPDGSIENFPPDQAFEIGISDGCGSGQLIICNDEICDSNSYFYNVRPDSTIYFIADSSADNGEIVKFRVGLVKGGGGVGAGKISSVYSPAGKEIHDSITDVQQILQKNRAIKKSKGKRVFNPSIADSLKDRMMTKLRKTNSTDSANKYCSNAVPLTEEHNFGEVKIKDEIEILLGETKYFQARYADSLSNELVIEEVNPGSDGVPKLNGGLATDVWGDNPVSIDTGENYGKRMGVYWETEKPVWDGNTNKGNLEKGLIRLVGRYWSKDSTYVVKLKARGNSDSAEIIIKIIKPSKLLSANEKYPYNKYIDIDSSAINIDTLCIIKGGKYGLPPNIIKGQIFQETAKIKRVFYPSYRYEPFTTQWDIYLKTWSGKFYFKDSLSVDYSDVPNHINVKYINYVREVKTVWDIINEYSQLINQLNPSEYGRRNNDHSMDFNKKFFPGIQNQYESFLNGFKMNIKLTKIQAADSANKRMATWFKNEWRNGRANKTIAQTRCASSYGLLQMLYTTARERGYNKSNLPEDLNNIKLFDNWLKYQETLLYKNLKNKNNWVNGFEKTFKENILENWNKASTYPKIVITNSLKFLPQR